MPGRSNAELSTEELNARKALVAERTSFGVLLTDARGLTQWINPAFERLSGYSLQDLIGRKPGQVLQNERTDPAVLDELRAAIREGRSFRGDLINRSKAGVDYIVAIELDPLHDEAGALVGFAAIQTDVTGHRQAERDLAEASARARFEAQRLNLALAGGDLGFWDWNPTTSALTVNDAWRRVLGFEAHDLKGDSSDWTDLLHPDDTAQAFAALASHFDGSAEIYEARFRMRHKDGHYVPLMARGKVVEWGDSGEPTRMLGIQIDRTAEAKRHDELDRLRVEAELASRAKSEFLANMSHEIRTPLTAILGYSELLQEAPCSADAWERRSEMVDAIHGAGQHLLTLINDILDLSKIESGRMRTERLEVDLPALLREVLDLTRPQTVDKEVTLELSLDSPIPTTIFADPTRLRQILVNLLGNAAKFTEVGSVKLCVEVVDGERLQVAVADTGSGMSEAQAEGLFQPFVQADGTVTRRYGGTGLGLTISRRLARLLGGNVTLVRSELGRGSRFMLEAPLELAPGARFVTEIGASPPAHAPRTTAPGTLTGRVLLAEDGPMNQRLIRAVLTRAGFEVDVVDHGADALALLAATTHEGRRYDLLLTDMQMPVMDGYTLAKTLREQGCALPIIALTANAMAEDETRCLAAGCDDFTTKPIDRPALLSKLAKWIERGRPSSAAQGPEDPRRRSA
ncbi:MAG: PAS domain-containing protein [Planctomycetota bacterium]